MIVDTSALIAIIKAEPDARTYLDALRSAPTSAMGAPTLVEAGMVAAGGGRTHLARLRRLIDEAEIEIVPFTQAHAVRALDAFESYGRGSGHPARLNFGDCLSYAVSSLSGRPLLYKGDDFAHTDLSSALD